MTTLAQYEALAASVHGWMAPAFTRVLAAIKVVHQTARVRGPVAEIGVHCGRSFIPLVLMKHASETAFALDCFDDQAANTGRSGGATKQQFLDSLRGLDVPMSGVEILQCDTRKIPHPLLSLPLMRVISVDGDHSEEETYRDLEAASARMVEGGYVILDDAFNEEWPAVSSGLHRFMGAAGVLYGMMPALAGFGKMVLAHAQFAALLQTAVRAPSSGLLAVREQEVWSYPLLSVRARDGR